MSQLTTANAFLADLLQRRGLVGSGFNCERMLEWYGATIVEPTAFQPDPITHRHTYYYDAGLNRLFRRVIDATSPAGAILAAHWVPA